MHHTLPELPGIPLDMDKNQKLPLTHSKSTPHQTKILFNHTEITEDPETTLLNLRKSLIQKVKQTRGARKILTLGIDNTHVGNTINSMNYCLSGSNTPIVSQNNARFALDKYTILRNEKGTRKLSFYNLIGIQNVGDIDRAVHILRLILEGVIEPGGFKMSLAMDGIARNKLENKNEKNVCDFFDGILFVENCPNYEECCDLSDLDDSDRSESDSISEFSDCKPSFNLGETETERTCHENGTCMCEVDEENSDFDENYHNHDLPLSPKIIPLGAAHEHSNCDDKTSDLAQLICEATQNSKFEIIKNMPLYRIVPFGNIQDPVIDQEVDKFLYGNGESTASEYPKSVSDDIFLHENAQSLNLETSKSLEHGKSLEYGKSLTSETRNELRKQVEMSLRRVQSSSVISGRNLGGKNLARNLSIKNLARKGLGNELGSSSRLNAAGSNEWFLYRCGSKSSIVETAPGTYKCFNPEDDITQRGSSESICSVKMTNTSKNSMKSSMSSLKTPIQFPEDFHTIDPYTWRMKLAKSGSQSKLVSRDSSNLGSQKLGSQKLGGSSDSLASNESRILEPTLLPPEKIKPEKHNQLLRILNDLFSILNEPHGEVANRNRIRVCKIDGVEQEPKKKSRGRRIKRRVSKMWNKMRF